MGTRGPIGRPARLKALEGNPGKRPLTQSPRPGRTSAACPRWLSKEAKAEWKRCAPEMKRLGLLTALDVTPFAIYCESYASWLECEKVLAEQGRLYIAPRGQLKTRPEFDLAQTYAQTARTFAAEFGLTPGSRSRLSLDGIEGTDCGRCGMPPDLCGCAR